MNRIISTFEFYDLIKNNTSIVQLNELIHQGINEIIRMTDDQLLKLIEIKDKMIQLEKRNNEKKNNKSCKRKNARKM